MQTTSSRPLVGTISFIAVGTIALAAASALAVRTGSDTAPSYSPTVAATPAFALPSDTGVPSAESVFGLKNDSPAEPLPPTF